MQTKSPQSNSSFLLGILLVATWCLTTFKIRTFEIWHLLASAQEFFRQPTLVFREALSYTFGGQKWVNQEWLGELIIYGTYSVGGFSGLIILKSLLVCLAVWMLYKHMLNRGANPIVIFWVLLVAVFLCRFRLTVRPQMFSFVFVIYLAQLLYQFKIGQRKSLWVVIPLMCVWTNIHFGSLLGLFVIGIYVGSAFLALYVPRFFDGNLVRPVDKAFFTHLLLVFTASLAACFLNPATFQFLTMPLEVAFISVKYRVMESLPIRLFAPTVFPLFWTSLLVYFALIIRSMKRMDVFDLMILLMSAAMALKMARFVALYAILSTPVVIQYWSELADGRGFWKRLADRLSDRRIIIGVSAVSVLGAIVLNVGLLRNYQFGYGLNSAVQPVEAVEFLQENKITGNVYNDINWGGYIVFNQPDTKVFMYPRYSVFRDYVYDAYYRVLRAEPEWQSILNKYQVEIVLLSRPVADLAPMTEALNRASNWTLVFENNKSVIYLRNKSRFKNVIQQYAVNSSENEVDQ